MTSITRESIRRARDAHMRAKLGRTTGGRPANRRREESDATETMPGAWMPMQAPRPKLSPFFALAAYEGEEC